MERSFAFFAPLTFFEKAGAPAGKTRRIAGIVSTEVKDKQDETVLQRGLDFSPFVRSGWFNDNHSKRTTDVLGYPDGDVRKFQKGDVLPDGSVAKVNGTWAEGYLLDTPEAQRVWDLGQALAKAGSQRRLGFSIEGQVMQRTGPGGKTVAKALVRNVAITNCPVGEDTRLEVLAKSLVDLEKGMTAGGSGVPPDHNASEAGPVTGAGAGKVLARRHIETGGATNLFSSVDEKKDEDEITKSSAVAAIQGRMRCDRATAERAYSLLCTMKRQSLL